MPTFFVSNIKSRRLGKLIYTTLYYEGCSINSFLISIGSLFMGGFTSFSVIINSNLSLIGRKH